MSKLTFLNKTLLLFAFVSVLTSCKFFNGYSIDGTIKNGNGIKVYLEDILQNPAVTIDTTTIVNGKFSLHNYSEKGIYRLRFGDDETKSIFIFLDKKEKLHINGDLQSLGKYTIKGNDASETIKTLVQTTDANFDAMDSAIANYSRAGAKLKDSLLTVVKAKKQAHIDYIKSFVKKEQNNEVACFALNYLGPLMSEEMPYIIDIVKELHESSPNSIQINIWYGQVQQYEQQTLAQQEAGLPIGTFAPNIILQTPQGDTIQLKDLKGKYVLLDFWASWCQPCRQNNPHLVDMYEKFHFQGLEFFSVSLDDMKEHWVNAIEHDGLKWQYQGCDFKKWNSPIVNNYKISSIPSVFILDKSGKIIAKNLHGKDLENKLTEIFSSK